MKCLILAAGYATRLYPLTESFPKPLLKVGEKTILDWLIDDIDTAGAVNEYVVISNHKFAEQFEAWAKAHTQRITVVDDGTESNETRLGAVCDIQYAIDALNLHDNLLVIAGDNVLDFSLTGFIAYALAKGTSCTMRYLETDTKRLHRTGVSEIGEGDRLLSLEEKPENPKSNWATPPFYFYTKEDVALIRAAIEDGCPTDAPGSLAGWLCARRLMYSMLMPGQRYDIGNLEDYTRIRETYHGITNRILNP